MGHSRHYKNSNGKYSTNVATVTNEDGFNQEVSLVAIEDRLVNKVKAGFVHFVSARWTGITNGASIYFRAKVADLKTLHFFSEYNTVGLWQFDSYLDSTYTDDGTEVEAINRRPSKGDNINSVFYRDPVVDVLGSLRLSFDFGGGSVPAQASSTQKSDQLESIFDDGDDILIKLTNLSGATQRMSVVANVYEEAYDFTK